jgi:hypothetical protein
MQITEPMLALSFTALIVPKTDVAGRIITTSKTRGEVFVDRVEWLLQSCQPMRR